MSQYTIVNRTLAGVAFLAALVTYMLTLQPSVPFWDCGEFTAAMAWQQVQHPPGAPLWSLAGRMIQMLPIGDPGWTANLAAAVSSAFSALLAYLIGVLALERIRPFREDRSVMSHLPVFGGALIGALAFVWSDSQWYNSVESEVYAPATLLAAILIWLMLRWDRNAGKPGHERYLLMMAYVIGLAIGTHLLALLVVPAIALTIYFRHYNFSLKSFLALMVITGIAFFGLIYNAPLEYIPSLLSNNKVIGFVLLAGLIGLVWWAAREGKSIIALSTMSFLLIILGYTTYTQVMIRSNSNTPLNFGEPNTFAEIVDYLGRKQYGNRNTWPRRVEIDQYYRRYQDTYGEWFMPVGQNPDGTFIFDQINTSGEINFMMKYQIYHMYFRYFFWNFVGRASDEQDAPAVAFSASPEVRQTYITPTGYEDVFPVQFFALPLLLGLFGIWYHYKRDWKMAFIFTALFLFLGVFSALQQKQQQPQPRERDYFYAASFMIFAIWIGIGASGLVQTVRERRTAKVEGGAGAGDDESSNGLVFGVLGLCLVAVPLNMAYNGWAMHDRSGNWVPWDYAYNILQSTEKDAIIFTNGDNDTFPLWYLQDVAGVRRDVRIVNLSLAQMGWYLDQLKNQRPWGALPVPMSVADQVLRTPDGMPGGLSEPSMVPPTLSIDVPGDVMSWATKGASSAPGKMEWLYKGVSQGQGQPDRYRIYHTVIRDIIETNKWKRPVYFSTSIVEPEAFAGLDEFFRQEGMAYRIMPVKQQRGGILGYAVDRDIMKKALMETLPGDQFHTEPHYGFKFRNLDNHDVFFMIDHRRIPTGNYRVGFLGLALEEIKAGNQAGAVAALDKMEKDISMESFPLPYSFLAQIATIYQQAGSQPKAASYARKALDAMEALGAAIAEDAYAQQVPPDIVRAQMQTAMGDFDGAIATYKRLQQQYPANAMELRGSIDDIEIRKIMAKGDTAAALAEMQRMLAGYTDTSDVYVRANRAALELRIRNLGGARAPLDNTRTEDTGAATQSGPSSAR